MISELTKRSQRLDEFRRLARARREQIAIAFERRREQDFGRIGDRVVRRLERGKHDPDQRDHGDDGIEHHQRAGETARAGRGFDDGMGCVGKAHRLFTRFSAFT
jgi:hypothetical protein